LPFGKRTATQSKDPVVLDFSANVAGSSHLTSATTWELPFGFIWTLDDKGSFDSVAASLREAATTLRMTEGDVINPNCLGFCYRGSHCRKAMRLAALWCERSAGQVPRSVRNLLGLCPVSLPSRNADALGFGGGGETWIDHHVVDRVAGVGDDHLKVDLWLSAVGDGEVPVQSGFTK